MDPDPEKSLQLASSVISGSLVVGGANLPPRLEGFVRFMIPSAGQQALMEWLVELLWAESAASRLVVPGAGDHGLLLLTYEPGS